MFPAPPGFPIARQESEVEGKLGIFDGRGQVKNAVAVHVSQSDPADGHPAENIDCSLERAVAVTKQDRQTAENADDDVGVAVTVQVAGSNLVGPSGFDLNGRLI